jgi:hypothetical protein
MDGIASGGLSCPVLITVAPHLGTSHRVSARRTATHRVSTLHPAPQLNETEKLNCRRFAVPN